METTNILTEQEVIYNSLDTMKQVRMWLVNDEYAHRDGIIKLLDESIDKSSAMLNINEPKQETNLPSVWDFVAEYYQNYHSCDEIAHANDLCKIVNNEVQDGDCSYDLWQEILTQFDGNEEEAMEDAKRRYNEHHITIYNEAIEGLGIEFDKITDWIVDLAGDNNEKIVRLIELQNKDFSGVGLIDEEQDELYQLGLEVREEAITEYIKRKGGL